MNNLVTFAELKSGKKLGLRGGFLVFSEKNGYHLLFQSESSGEKFFLKSQRGDGVKLFKTLDAVKGAIESAGLQVWPMQIFGDFKLI